MYTGQKISSMDELKNHFKKYGYKILIDKEKDNYKLSLSGDTSENILNSCNLDDYIYFKEHLLLLEKFYRVEDKTYQKIGDQDKEKEAIKGSFDYEIKKRFLRFEEDLNEIYTQIMNEAYGENIAYNFKHNINPPMLVLENKKSDEEN